MSELILQSIGLLAATFAIFSGLGALLAGPKKRRTRASAFQATDLAFAPEPLPAPEVRRPEPVRYLDAAAEHFTVGVVKPKPIDLDRPAYTPITGVVFDSIPLEAAVQPVESLVAVPAQPKIIDDVSPVHRLSSLVVMTPESVEAAVQQAGSGLEPLRLRGAQGAPDDLTVISGITADQQRQLNEYGVYHFWQIAGWSPENVAWVSQRVLSPHRIARENWMAQAAKLAGLKG